ncbi:MAG: anaerobic ribonucleoside-triphosphate reductase activating protein [Clostridia bacterium]|nr:anaerobic ribonucleoside-triphosphate reductase activating protein [Clostridia bacterium]
MNYATIKYNDIANGLGVRTSLFVSGCTHRCKGCFNSEAWDFKYGKPFTEEVENAIIVSLEGDFNDGLSLLGGEPFEPKNQKALRPFLEKVKALYPTKTIWCYTGYVLETDLLNETGRAHTDDTIKMLLLIDVLVDGPFIEEQKNISLRFKGSENQRIIDVPSSLKNNKTILFEIEKY